VFDVTVHGEEVLTPILAAAQGLLLAGAYLGSFEAMSAAACGHDRLRNARALHDARRWPAPWPAAPEPGFIHGVELMPREVERARLALGHLGERVKFTVGDMCSTAFEAVDVVVTLAA
jgi:hypothetical protein